MTSVLRGRPRRIVLLEAGGLILLIALADWQVDAEVPLGFLYLLPMFVVGAALSRVQILLAVSLCTLLAEVFDSFRWSLSLGIPRDVLYFSAFAGIGFFAHQVAVSRARSAEHLAQVEREVKARQDAEEQMSFLVESSPAAILTMESDGTVLLSNDAANRLFAAEQGLRGRPVSAYLPSLAKVPALGAGRPSFRTVMQCRGHRENGEIFLADVWFSTYATSSGPRLSAMIVDTSEELRDREEASLHQLLSGSRILVGAVSHEVRNVCGAIAVVHENLARGGTLAGSKDFEALGTLVTALERIASVELSQLTDQVSGVDLEALLEEVSIVIAPALREQEIELVMNVAPGLPRVLADRHSLMQVLLNLVKNSERALESNGSGYRRLAIDLGESADGRIIIRIEDTGRGVAAPELLFKPFQPQARATGLGLYLSRAMMRSFSGDLRYEPLASGACFVVELAPLVAPAAEHAR